MYVEYSFIKLSKRKFKKITELIPGRSPNVEIINSNGLWVGFFQMSINVVIIVRSWHSKSDFGFKTTLKMISELSPVAHGKGWWRTSLETVLVSAVWHLN